MKDYCFFFSYSRVDRISTFRKDLVKQLYDDLNARVIGFGWREGGFFDTSLIDPGENWTDDLENALSWARIMVPLYSPNYLSGVYCPKEWQVFYERHLQYKKSLPVGVETASVIRPINWIPERLPDPVGQFQEGGDRYPQTYNIEGLKYMMTRPRKFHEQYQDFLDTVAQDLVRKAYQQGDPRVRVIPRLKDVHPAFSKFSRPGPQHVRFIFVAGTISEMMDKGRSVQSYGEFDDRKDWKPCFPDQTQLAGDIARDAARDERREFQFLRPSIPLIDQVKDAEAMNNAVIILIDPWSINLQTFKDFVEKFDHDDFPNCAVVVAWPPKVSETNTHREILLKEVQSKFRRRIEITKAYYRDEVSSAEELSKILVEAFYKIGTELVDRGRVVPTAAGPAPGKPILRI